MSEESIKVRSSISFRAAAVLGLIFVPVLGAWLSRAFVPVSTWDWASFLAVFFCVPGGVAAIAYLVGWRAKKLACDYSPPEWEFKPVQMTIQDAEELPRTYYREFRGFAANSNFWMFFAPVVLVTYLIGLPIYIYTTDPALASVVDILFAVPLAALFVVSLAGGYLATSNAASEDFTLPLIREAVKLARTQEKIPGATHVYVVMDKAEYGGFRIYTEPRVILRIQGLENEGYVESWSGEVGSVWRMLCRLYESEGKPQVVWWWVAHDRVFRKFQHPDEQGYYVRFPVHSDTQEPGVKDVELLTKNAVAILIREWLHTRDLDEALEALMKELGAEAE
jgi:hypothetical protein